MMTRVLAVLGYQFLIIAQGVLLPVGIMQAASLTSAFAAGVVVSPPSSLRQTFTKTIYVDPVGGNDLNDGLSDREPKKSLDFLSRTAKGDYPIPGSLVALKRGTVLRLKKSLAFRGGSRDGWVTYGAYGSGEKPILIGSAPITSWANPSENLYTFDWSGNLDVNDHRSVNGVEQGPGNLWFFTGSASSSAMIGWGWRKQVMSTMQNHGDWYYDPITHKISLYFKGGAPAYTEAGVNRRMVDTRGQSYIVVQDLDFRYGGNYVMVFSTAEHLLFRNLDMSYFGGGTKNGAYVRLGNGIEFTGDVNDATIEHCRVHQAFDSGFNPQNASVMPAVQENFSFKNNLVSFAGLAGFEILEKPVNSRLCNLVLENNTFLHSGRGWGCEQHDFPGSQPMGADIAFFQCSGASENISIHKNLFINPKVVLVSGYYDRAIKSLLQGIHMDHNLWCTPGTTIAAILHISSLADSIIFSDLAAWQAGTQLEIKAKDSGSLSASDIGAVGFVSPSDPSTQDSSWIWKDSTDLPVRPQLFGRFSLKGDYMRTGGPGTGWGWVGP